MNDVMERNPRWWRLQPKSQVEISWEDHDHELMEYGSRDCIRTLSRRSIYLRAYQRNPPGWWPEMVYGPWQMYDTYPYMTPDGASVRGMTRIVDGIPIVYVHALEAPGLGDWTAVDATEVLEEAA